MPKLQIPHDAEARLMMLADAHLKHPPTSEADPLRGEDRPREAPLKNRKPLALEWTAASGQQDR